MKRRDFLKNSLGFAGLLSVSGASVLLNEAVADTSLHAHHTDLGLNREVTAQRLNFVKISEKLEHDFKHGKHRVKIHRRGYADKISKSKVETWAMSLNGKELNQVQFRRHATKAAYFSDYLPFHYETDPRKLAAALIRAQELNLFVL